MRDGEGGGGGGGGGGRERERGEREIESMNCWYLVVHLTSTRGSKAANKLKEKYTKTFKQATRRPKV